VSRTFCKVPLLVIVLVKVILLSNCGSSSSSPEMSPAVVSVSLSSQSTSAVVGQTVQFTATVTGSSNNSVTWSVNGVAGGNSSIGAISATGIYTAPAVPPSPNTVTVQATSVADTTKMASLTLTVSNPAPQLSAISPAAMGIGGNSAQVPATGTVLTLNGAGFASQSAVIANATPLATTFVSASQLTATVPANLVASPGVLQLTVSTPAPGGGTSSSVSFTVLAVGQVSSTNNPQVAQYSIAPPRSANVSIEFGPDTNYGLQTWSQPTSTGGGTLNMLVAGMRGFTTYHMRAVVSFPDGTQYTDPDQTFTTGGLPSQRVPQLTVTEPTPGLSPYPGIELLDLVGSPTNQVVAAAIDLQGNLIWYYDFPNPGNETPAPIKPLSNGHMKLNIGLSTGVDVDPSSVNREIDLAGNTISELTVPQLNNALAAAGSSIVALGFHHDFALLPNGHTVYIVSEQEDFTDLPGLPGITTVTGDALVDLDPNDNVAWTWSTFDHFDVNYHPLGLTDWTHSNAIVYSPSDGNLLLSCRNISLISKIDYRNGAGTGDVLWQLGPNGSLNPLNLMGSSIVPNPGPSDWFYNQHFPVFLGSVTAGFFRLGVWDNGNTRPDPSTGLLCGTAGAAPCYSRGVTFQINESAKTAQITFQDKLPFAAICCGNIGILGNNDFEFGAGAESINPGSGLALEVTPSGSQTVWQLSIENQFAYRAFRIPSLYPGVQW
jgi:arylsulfate sulfotransferase